MEKTASELAVERFLATGIVSGLSDQELASACDAEVQRISRASLKAALPVAAKFTKQARKRGGVLESTAYRTEARVLHLSGNHAAALKAYLNARKLNSKDALVRSRIDRALIDV